MGPIIAQDVVPVGYKDSVDDYISQGRDIEELVFSRAIKAHADDKIIVHENRTIVFD
jgi:formyltetrahydrofolate deformylase